MPQVDNHPPGEFCWLELATGEQLPDPGADGGEDLRQRGDRRAREETEKRG